MSIHTKIIGCFLAILFLFASASIFSYISSRQANTQLALVNELFLPLSRELVQLEGNIHSLAEDMQRLYFSGEGTSFSGGFTRMVKDLYPYEIRKKFVTVAHLLERSDDPELKKRLDELSKGLSKAQTNFDGLCSVADKESFDRVYSNLRLELASLARQVEDDCQAITLASQKEASENLLSGFTLSSIVVLFGLLTVLLSHRALSPLPTLIQNIKKIASGDLSQSLKVKTSDNGEIALLAREYNHMLEALRERDLEIQRQQKELLQAERLAAVGQLSAEIVHEIRNPLNSISLNIDWLEDELKGSRPQISRTVMCISREIERLNQITESYLVRARVPAQEQQDTEIHELLHEIIEFSKEEDRSRGIHIKTDFQLDEIVVCTDRSRLKQAFLNVLKNAKEAMPRGGMLTIKTELNDNLCRIKFTDNGHGMSESVQLRTFQPFFTTKPNGTGLGLLLTKSIAEEAHGEVYFESELGAGTTFTFEFPA